MAKRLNDTQMVTGEVRVSYCNLLEAKKFKETDKEAKFSCVALISKTTESGKETYKMLMECIAKAAEKGAQKHFGGRVPTNVPHTVQDGDTATDDLGDLKCKKNPEYAGNWFVRLSTKYKPVIKDRSLVEIKNPLEIYSGMHAQMSVTAYAYSGDGKRGISFVLNNVVKTRDGEPLTSRLVGDEFDAEMLEASTEE